MQIEVCNLQRTGSETWIAEKGTLEHCVGGASLRAGDLVKSKCLSVERVSKDVSWAAF